MITERFVRFLRREVPLSTPYLLIVVSMSFNCGSPGIPEAQVVESGSPSLAVLSRLPTAEETEQQWRNQDPSRFLEIHADLNGNGFSEVATLLINETRKPWTLIVEIASSSEPAYVSRALDVEVPFDELDTTGIRLVEPGVYETACGKAQRECRLGEPKTIELTRPSISIFERGGPEMIFFWDIDKKSYVGVDVMCSLRADDSSAEGRYCFERRSKAQ